jgi:RecA-family ATPase
MLPKMMMLYNIFLYRCLFLIKRCYILLKIKKDDMAIERISKLSNYMKPVIVIKSNNSELLTSNSLCLVKGEVGSGKSRLVMNIMTGLLSGNDDLKLHYTKCPKDKQVVYVSTEMSKYHLQRRLLKVLDNIPNELEENLVFLDFSTSEDKIEDLTNALEDLNPYVIIIDQIADFILNINDIESGIKLYKKINYIIEKFGVSVITILHQNEDSGINSKARGHLGSILEQKSVSSIAISNTRDGFKIRTTKLREGVHMYIDAEFNKETEMLKAVKKLKTDEILVKLKLPATAQELISQYMELINKSESYVRKEIKKLVEEKKLQTTKEGKNVIYSL